MSNIIKPRNQAVEDYMKNSIEYKNPNLQHGATDFPPMTEEEVKKVMNNDAYGNDKSKKPGGVSWEHVLSFPKVMLEDPDNFAFYHGVIPDLPGDEASGTYYAIVVDRKVRNGRPMKDLLTGIAGDCIVAKIVTRYNLVAKNFISFVNECL